MPRRRTGQRCGIDLIVAAALAVLLGSLAFAMGQAGTGSAAATKNPPSTKPDTETQPIRVQSNLVTAPVTVIDRATGGFVYDLDQADFSIYDNGKPQRIQRFDREPHKIAVVIVVQTSDVVAPLLKEVKLLAPLFSQLMLGSKGEAAVVFYSGQVQRVQDFSNSGNVLDKTLQSIKPSGSGSRLNDAMMQAMDLLEHRPKDERRVIVAFSTGYDSGSSTNKTDVIRRATHSEVEVYGLNLSLSKATLTRKPEPRVAQNPQDINMAGPSLPGRPNTPTNSQQSFGTSADVTQDLATAARLAKATLIRNDMENYCRYTGGKFYTQWSAQALQVNLSQIASELHSQYELAYVPDNLSTTGFHRIEVKVNRKHVRVRTRLGYFYFTPYTPGK